MSQKRALLNGWRHTVAHDVERFFRIRLVIFTYSTDGALSNTNVHVESHYAPPFTIHEEPWETSRSRDPGGRLARWPCGRRRSWGAVAGITRPGPKARSCREVRNTSTLLTEVIFRLLVFHFEPLGTA